MSRIPAGWASGALGGLRTRFGQRRDPPAVLGLDQLDRVVGGRLVGGGRVDARERLVAVDADRADLELGFFRRGDLRADRGLAGQPRLLDLVDECGREVVVAQRLVVALRGGAGEPLQGGTDLVGGRGSAPGEQRQRGGGQQDAPGGGHGARVASEEMVRAPLFDGHGRAIRDLRVSVTDRCNFRCQYCMPAEGLPWLERSEVLSFEELERLVALLASMGVGAVRLTGGEPLVRRDFPRLAAMLAAVPGLDDLALTTNGYLLERDAEALVGAGIRRFNVSIDSLQRDRFFAMTRRDALPRVLRGLEALAAHPEAHPIKVNAVAMRGFTEEEVLPFARFAREHPYEVRFIEFMPLDA